MYALTVWLGSRPSTLARIYLLVGRLQKENMTNTVATKSFITAKSFKSTQ
jgi:hypothetical protein